MFELSNKFLHFNQLNNDVKILYKGSEIRTFLLWFSVSSFHLHLMQTYGYSVIVPPRVYLECFLISFVILLSFVENILSSIHQTLKVFSSSLIRLSKVQDALSFLSSNYNQRIIIVIWLFKMTCYKFNGFFSAILKPLISIATAGSF